MSEEKPAKQEGKGYNITVSPALPCTTADCPNYATVAGAYYNQRSNCWEIYPLCKACTKSLLKKYEAE